MKIEVTQEDIDCGLAGDCRNCPVARAMNRATGDVWEVGNGWMRRDSETRRRLPCAVLLFIHRFDKHKTGEPFSFDLDLEATPCTP